MPPQVVPVRQVLKVREDAVPGTSIGTVAAADEDPDDVLEYVLLDKTGE